MSDLKRTITQELIKSASSYPVVTIIGPRQSGKTTLAKSTFPNKTYVSLEDPDLQFFAKEDPRAFLAKYPDGAILDEIQRAPLLLSYIQGIVDNNPKLGHFILTGSHQFLLQEQITQSLAGRTGVLQLMPFSLQELQPLNLRHDLNTQLFFGFYPRIFKHNIEPQRFYRDYVQTYIERDIKMLVNVKDLEEFQRFLQLCATRVGQLLDYTQLANDLGIARQTIKTWLSILKASFIITVLPPYFENLGKRIIKSNKLYFNDVGLLCYLLGIRNSQQLENHPLRGYLFENLVVNEIYKLFLNNGEDLPLYFYRDSNQVEIDVVFVYGTKLFGIEIKASKTFNNNFLKGLRKLKELATQHNVIGTVIYSGDHQQKIHDFTVLNYNNIAKILV